MTRMALVSDLVAELEDGTRYQFPPTFSLPFGLDVGGEENGDSAPGSLLIVRSGYSESGGIRKEKPNTKTITGTGTLHAQSSVELIDKVNELSEVLGKTRKVWRGSRAYLRVHYGLLPSPIMGWGWLSAEVTPIFRLEYLSWLQPEYDSNGNLIRTKEVLG